MYLIGFGIAYFVIKKELTRKNGPIPPEADGRFLVLSDSGVAGWRQSWLRHLLQFACLHSPAMGNLRNLAWWNEFSRWINRYGCFWSYFLNKK